MKKIIFILSFFLLNNSCLANEDIEKHNINIEYWICDNNIEYNNISKNLAKKTLNFNYSYQKNNHFLQISKLNLPKTTNSLFDNNIEYTSIGYGKNVYKNEDIEVKLTVDLKNIETKKNNENSQVLYPTIGADVKYNITSHVYSKLTFNGFQSNDKYLTDTKIGLGYNINNQIAFDVGYRQLNIKKGDNAKTKTDGIYSGLEIYF